MADEKYNVYLGDNKIAEVTSFKMKVKKRVIGWKDAFVNAILYVTRFRN